MRDKETQISEKAHRVAKENINNAVKYIMTEATRRERKKQQIFEYNLEKLQTRMENKLHQNTLEHREQIKF
jgi:hypothetical protein